MITLEAVVGVLAISGGVGLIHDGMTMQTAWIGHTLFPNWTIPGILLIVCVGGGLLGAAMATMVDRRLAAPAALISGVILIVWVSVETLMIGWHGGPQGPLDAAIVAASCALIGLAWRYVSLHGTGLQRPSQSREAHPS